MSEDIQDTGGAIDNNDVGGEANADNKSAEQPPNADASSSTTSESETVTDGAESDKQTEDKTDWRKMFYESAESPIERKKIENMLSNMDSPEALIKKVRNLEKKLSSTRPADAPEEIEGYYKVLGDDIQFSDADKSMLDSFFEYAKADGLPADIAKTAVNWYLEQQDNIIQEQSINDLKYKSESESVLREEWGNEFKRNNNVLDVFFKGQGKALAEKLEGARDADGNLLIYNPEFRAGLYDLAKEFVVTSSVLPQAMNEQGARARLAEIESKMGTKEYTPAMQREALELIKYIGE